MIGKTRAIVVKLLERSLLRINGNKTARASALAVHRYGGPTGELNSRSRVRQIVCSTVLANALSIASFYLDLTMQVSNPHRLSLNTRIK